MFGAEDRPFDFQVFRAVLGFNDDGAGEIADPFAFGLDDLDAALFGNHRSIDVVHRRLHHRRQKPFQQGHGQRRDIVLGDVAAVLDLNFLGQGAGHLRVQAAKLFRQGEEGAQDFE